MTLIEMIHDYQDLLIKNPHQSAADRWLKNVCEPQIYEMIRDTFDPEGQLVGDYIDADNNPLQRIRVFNLREVGTRPNDF